MLFKLTLIFKAILMLCHHRIEYAVDKKKGGWSLGRQEERRIKETNIRSGKNLSSQERRTEKRKNSFFEKG